ncbi:MAG: methyltransferase domain-containing protein [Chloroflexia bacterium]
MNSSNSIHRPLTPPERRESAYIVREARCYARQNPGDLTDLAHIDNPAGAAVYVRMAARIDRTLPRNARVLDWGCGYGQISWLLANRGHTVYACDWGKRPRISAFLDDRITYFPLTSPVQIDAPEAAFDAVISIGTLEHANNIFASMCEIRRILKPGGWFIIFRFPNDLSITEYAARRLGLWAHSVRMSKAELRMMLRMFSFRIDHIGYDSLLPVVVGRESSFRGLVSLRSRFDGPITWLDGLLTRLPLISAFSTSLHCFAQVNTEYSDVSD